VSMAATVFVVDDDPSVRKALIRVLRSAGLEVVAFSSAQEYIDAYDPNVPGCLILDLAMPGIGGLDLQAILRSKGTAPPIVFLSGRAALSEGIQAMKEGAVEFLIKPVEDQALLVAVHAAIMKDQVDRAARVEIAEIRRRLATLTPRELQVLRCVLGGMLNKQTAAELGTVEKTIKVHRARVMEKMQVSSLADLVRLSGRAGIVATPASQRRR
jgi:FixJ family two-component response regulator